jgi:cysteinyl-tRNA synthetase, unknown class
MMLPRSLLRVLLFPLALSAVAGFAGAVAATSVALPSAGKPPAPTLASPAQLQAEGTAAAERRRRMSSVANWGYWLSNFEPAGLTGAPHDLMVIDSEVSANRVFEREYTASEVLRMKRRSDASPRVLLAYLSIGEAERYRPYWRQSWYDSLGKPTWLGNENRRWVGNFAVQYWNAEWQQLIFGTPESYLDRVIAHGFDGVYLDRADAFFEWKKTHPSARTDMATFIARLSAHARMRNPQFLIVMQNAEELLDEAVVFDAIDGIAKEDLLYGVRRAEEPNKPGDVAWSIDLLRTAQQAGRKVLVVEYLKDTAKMSTAASRLREEGFIPYFAPRRLGCLNPPAVLTAAGTLPDHPCR